MIGLFCFVLAVLASPFKSKLRLEAENAVLRHQLIILRRRLHGGAALLALSRALACTNIVENVMSTVRRVCRNVKRWRSGLDGPALDRGGHGGSRKRLPTIATV